jgi:hypothetical protein
LFIKTSVNPTSSNKVAKLLKQLEQ